MVEDSFIAKAQLERMTFAARTKISGELTKDFAIAPEVMIRRGWMLDEVVLEIRQHVYGRKAKEIEAQYPTTWWDAVKERFAPEWFKRCWPVRYTHIKLTARELYPHIAMPERSPVLSLTKLIDGTPNQPLFY